MTQAEEASPPPSSGLRLAALGLIGAFAGLFLAELLIRAALPGGNWTPKAPVSTNILELQPGGSYRLQPSLDTQFQWNWRHSVPIYTDADGLRIPEPDWQRPEGEKVLVVGASYSWGFGVKAEEAWSFVMAEELAKKSHDINVLNAAQMGFTLPNMLAYLENLDPSEYPDKILLGLPLQGLYILGLGYQAEGFEVVNAGDGLANMHLRKGQSEQPLEAVNGWILRKDRPWAGTPLDYLRTGSALGHRVMVRADTNFRGAGVRRLEDQDDLDEEKTRQDCRDIGERLAAVNKTFADAKVPMTVVILPIAVGLMNRLRRNYSAQEIDYLREFGRASGWAGGRLRVFDMTLQGSPWKLVLDESLGGDFFLPFDAHYSVSGQRKVGERVAEWYAATDGGAKR